jgi:hypothetical protein
MAIKRQKQPHRILCARLRAVPACGSARTQRRRCIAASGRDLSGRAEPSGSFGPIHPSQVPARDLRKHGPGRSARAAADLRAIQPLRATAAADLCGRIRHDSVCPRGGNTATQVKVTGSGVPLSSAAGRREQAQPGVWSPAKAEGMGRLLDTDSLAVHGRSDAGHSESRAYLLCSHGLEGLHLSAYPGGVSLLPHPLGSRVSLLPRRRLLSSWLLTLVIGAAATLIRSVPRGLCTSSLCIIVSSFRLPTCPRPRHQKTS